MSDIYVTITAESIFIHVTYPMSVGRHLSRLHHSATQAMAVVVGRRQLEAIPGLLCLSLYMTQQLFTAQ